MKRLIQWLFGSKAACKVYGHTYRLSASLGGGRSKTDCPRCGHVFHEQTGTVYSRWTDENGKEWERTA